MRPGRRMFGGVVLAATAALLVTAAPALGAFPGGNGRLATTFFSFGDFSTSLVTMDADGSDQATIPTPGVTPASPKWSPDGQRLAFSDNSGTAIWVVDADGS